MVGPDFETLVFDIMKDRPVSAETISVITGFHTNYVLMKLRRMEKWGLVEPVTKKEVMMWAPPRKSGLRSGNRFPAEGGQGLVPADRGKALPR